MVLQMKSYFLYATKLFYCSDLFGHITKNITVFNVGVFLVYGVYFMAIFENMGLVFLSQTSKSAIEVVLNSLLKLDLAS